MKQQRKITLTMPHHSEIAIARPFLLRLKTELQRRSADVRVVPCRDLRPTMEKLRTDNPPSNKHEELTVGCLFAILDALIRLRLASIELLQGRDVYEIHGMNGSNHEGVLGLLLNGLERVGGSDLLISSDLETFLLSSFPKSIGENTFEATLGIQYSDLYGRVHALRTRIKSCDLAFAAIEVPGEFVNVEPLGYADATFVTTMERNYVLNQATGANFSDPDVVIMVDHILS